MDIERIVVRLVADASVYMRVLDSTQSRLLAFGGFISSYFARISAQLAADYERAAVSFEVMTKSAVRGRQLLDEITKVAIETPFTSSELIAAAKQIKAFGFDTEDVIPIIQRLGDVAQGTGSDLDRLILAFGQVRTTGRLMGQELRQFTNAGVPILEYLGKVIGVTSSEVPQLVRQGRVGFQDVAKAINMMTDSGGLFADMMGRINRETVYGRWQNLIESLQLTGRNLGLAAFDGLKMRDVLTALGNSIRDVDKESATDVFRGFRLSIYGTWKTIQDIIAATREWIQTNKQLVIAVGLSLVMVKAFTVAWGVFTALRASTLILDLVALTALVVPLTALIAALNELGTFDNIGESLGRGFREFAEEAKASWKGVTDALKGDDLKLAWDIVITTLKVGWQKLLLSLEAEFERLVFNLKFLAGERLTTFWNDISKGAQAAIARITGDEAGALRIEKHFNDLNDQVRRNYAASRALEEPALRARMDEIMSRGTPASDELRPLLNLASLKSMFAGMSNPTMANNLLNLMAGRGSGFFDVNGGANVPSGPVGGMGGFAALTGGAAVQGEFASRFREAAFQIANLRNAVEFGFPEDLTNKIRDRASKAVESLSNFETAMRGVDATVRKAVSEWPQISADAQHYASELMKEFREGIDPLEKFGIAVGRVREAAQGPLPGLSAVAGVAAMFAQPDKLGGILGGSAEQYGLFKEFDTLRKGIGNREDLLPPTVLAGSQQAADIINRSSQRAQTVDEQISRTLSDSKVIQESMRDYIKQVADGLKNRGVTNINVLRIGGGGG